MKAEIDNHTIDPADVLKIIKDNKCLALSTIDPMGKPWITPLYFTYDSKLNIYWISSKRTHHSLYIRERNNVTIRLSCTDSSNQNDFNLFIEANVSQITNPLTMLKVLFQEFIRLKSNLPNPNEFKDKRNFRVYQASPTAAWIITSKKNSNTHQNEQKIPIKIEDLCAKINE